MDLGSRDCFIDIELGGEVAPSSEGGEGAGTLIP